MFFRNHALKFKYQPCHLKVNQHHAMKTYSRMQALLTSALDGDEWSPLHPAYGHGGTTSSNH